MADPQHVPQLDGFDIFSVRLYRVGLTVATLGLAASTVQHARGADPSVAWGLLTAGVAVSALDLHLYDKRIRWLIHAMAWLGVALQLAPGSLLPAAGHGFLLAAISAFALKEQFCFRVPFLRLVPLLLAPSAFTAWLGPDLVTAGLHGLTAAMLTLLVATKWQQPVHYDIGDKSRYQI